MTHNRIDAYIDNLLWRLTQVEKELWVTRENFRFQIRETDRVSNEANELRTTIAGLHRKVRNLTSQLDDKYGTPCEQIDAHATIATLTRQIGEAKEALAPFVERADKWAWNTNAARVSVKLSDLRTAARVHAALSTSTDTGADHVPDGGNMVVTDAAPVEERQP